MNELEELRAQMVAAFHTYSQHDPAYRESLWDDYVRAREAFLRMSLGEFYEPLLNNKLVH